MASINNAALSNVYNFYQADLLPRSSSNRFDSHKKKDLQDVYKSIVKLSKDEPVFLMDRSREVEEYTIHMKENALLFRNRIASIGGLEEDAIFNQKTAYSSDADIAEVVGQPDEEAEAVTLRVNRLATPQENKGKFIPEDDMGLAPGSYSFDVATQSSNYELQFTIGDNDTNKDVQARLARLVNNFKLGLNASVEEDGAGNTALVIRSKSVGDRGEGGGHFTVSDENTSQRSGIVDYLGIRTPSDPGTDAAYSVNGKHFTSQSNDVKLEQGYELKLKSAAPGTDVTIGYKPDLESMKDNIVSLAGSYNDFLRATAEYIDRQPRTSLLVNDMKNSSATYTKMLQNMGVEQAEDGTLNVDSERLTESLKTGDPQEELDALKDFTKSALRRANQIQINPMDYVDKRIVAYKNPTQPHYANPYVTSAYSGMLFNGYM